MSSNKVSNAVRQHINTTLKTQGTQPKQNDGSLMCTHLKAALYLVSVVLSFYYICMHHISSSPQVQSIIPRQERKTTD